MPEKISERPTNQLAALQQFVFESNILLQVCHKLASKPEADNPFAPTDKPTFEDRWFDRMNQAYAAFTDDYETKAGIDALAGLFATVRGPFARKDGWELYRLVRDPSGIFLRKFESKLLAVESRVAALAVGAAKPAGVTAAGKRRKMTVEEKAMGILTEHPDWPNSRIARRGGFHVKCLTKSRTPKFFAARGLLAKKGMAEMDIAGSVASKERGGGVDDAWVRGKR
ncbi:MAG: hypothetical protein ABSB33_03295 [Tepidisphaeraceae bacterium]|jgi:hypothetical protein